MSHLPHRKETNCLNCGTTVIGKYCHNCGQENIEPKESLWHLILHFFNDLTHFDGKFLSSLKDLLFKPGFLSKEYMKGRRASYLNPIRMYVFTSFVFFLVFFSIMHSDEINVKDDSTIHGKTFAEIDSMAPKDFTEITKSINNGEPMTREQFKQYTDSIKGNEGITSLIGGDYKNKEDYDSLLKNGIIKDGWLIRKLTYKKIEINKKYGHEQGKLQGDFVNSFTHHFPQMLFISLPFVALFLKLFYIRQRKYYYVSHAIFTIHLYIFLFIVLLLEIGIMQLHRHWLNIVNNILLLAVLFYIYKAMRNFYEQKRFKTILKFILLFFSFFFLIAFLFVIFAFISVFQI